MARGGQGRAMSTAAPVPHLMSAVPMPSAASSGPATPPPTSVPPVPETVSSPPAVLDTGTAPLPLPAPAAGAPTGERRVTEQAWTPFATVGAVVLAHPSARVERVGFHQSNHDGAGSFEPLPGAVAPVTLALRDRGTGARTAADIVVDPDLEIRAPVTGTVLRAGTYVLYCQYSDDFVVIEPDAHPGWEVKLLHIDGEVVSAGEQVVAGESVLAAGPTPLPFESQVDELRTAEPAWPHVHLEVVDPSVPDRPSPGGGC